jgi:hypothetical protein
VNIHAKRVWRSHPNLADYQGDCDLLRLEQVGQLLVGTVRSVEGVQKERNIDALLAEFTENHMVFKVVWWIAAHDDLFPVHDRVSRAVIQTLKEAGIVSPYRKSRVSTGSRSHKRTRSHFAILASCGILLPTGFQPSKGGDMVCARGPLGA